MSTALELRPIKESTEDYEEAEKRMKEIFRKEIYFPLLRLLQEPRRKLANAEEDPLKEALRTGRLTFSRGVFSGRLSAAITKKLRQLGAKWDRKSSTYRLPQTSLPRDVREAISASEVRFNEKVASIDRKLAQILPEDIAGKIKLADTFDRALWKTEKDFQASVKGITIAPQLTPERRQRIADEWQTNMQLYIKDFTQKEILSLRANMKSAVFTGNRYGSLVKAIQDSYDVSANKAKFLARQETSLLMTKFKQVRYTDADVKEYRWGCVAGSKLHPVRPAHKRLEGKVFTWDDPPIVSEAGQPMRRANPGQDYNCRCFARPIVRFKA